MDMQWTLTGTMRPGRASIVSSRAASILGQFTHQVPVKSSTSDRRKKSLPASAITRAVTVTGSDSTPSKAATKVHSPASAGANTLLSKSFPSVTFRMAA